MHKTSRHRVDNRKGAFNQRRDAGAERVVVRPPTAKPMPGMATELERIAETVLR
jgi:hypothetical protein